MNLPVDVCCYTGQRLAVHEYLLALGVLNGTRRLQTMHDARDVRGMTGGTFFFISGHASAFPPDMMQELEARGWLIVVIDDRAKRRYATNRRVALPNHLTFCDAQCVPGKCSEDHERREVVARIDADD